MTPDQYNTLVNARKLFAEFPESSIIRSAGEQLCRLITELNREVEADRDEWKRAAETALNTLTVAHAKIEKLESKLLVEEDTWRASRELLYQKLESKTKDGAFARIVALLSARKPKINFANKPPEAIVKILEYVLNGLQKRGDHYKTLAYAGVLAPGERRNAFIAARKAGKTAKVSAIQDARDPIRALVKPYGWPERAEGKTALEYLALLLRDRDQLHGEARGLRHNQNRFAEIAELLRKRDAK